MLSYLYCRLVNYMHTNM